MATIGQDLPTLLDFLRREDKDHQIATIIEMLAKENNILSDAVYVECNDGSAHKSTQRTGIPEPAFRKYNQGVQPSKTETVQVRDTTGMLEDYGLVDKALADLHENGMAFRASEAAGKLQGFNNKVARYMFYGDTDTEPEAFLGLSPRFDDITGAASGKNIIDGGGTGSDNTSIWLVQWGEMSCHMIYPKGSAIGFQHRDLGEDTVQDPDGGEYQAYRDHFKWDLGMTVRDWRGQCRIANIDVSELTEDAATGAKLTTLMTRSLYRIQAPMFGTGRRVFYANNTIREYLHLQAQNQNNVRLTLMQFDGEEIPALGGVPIRRCDELLETEERVV